jgi:integrase
LSPELGALMIEERDRQETLLRQLHGLPDNVAPLQPQLAPDDFILPADPVDRRHPVSIRAMRSRVERKAAAVGLTGVTAHWLRHTTASAMLAGTDTEPGISVVDAAALLGHANPLTTAKTYADASATNMQRGASLAARLIAPVPAAPVERLPNNSARTSDRK